MVKKIELQYDIPAVTTANQKRWLKLGFDTGDISKKGNTFITIVL